MELEFIQCRDGLYAVDWTLVESIIRSNLCANALLRYSKEEVTEKWIGPNMHHWTVDWDKVREEKKLAPEFTNELRLRAHHSGMKPKLRELERMVRDTQRLKAEWDKKLQAAQSKTMANIATSVGRGEIGAEAARSVRDVSGSILMVGATVLSGGTMAGVAGVATLGGAINAGTTFQDTGSGSAAAVSFATGFIVNLIPVKAGAAAADKAIIFIIKSAIEAAGAFTQAVIEGETAKEGVIRAVESAVTSSLGAGAGKFLKTAAARKMLSKIAYPAALQIDFKASSYINRLEGVRDLTHGTLSTLSSSFINRSVQSMTGAIQTASRHSVPTNAPRQRVRRPILESALIVDEMMLNRAVQGPDKSEYRRLIRG